MFFDEQQGNDGVALLMKPPLDLPPHLLEKGRQPNMLTRHIASYTGTDRPTTSQQLPRSNNTVILSGCHHDSTRLDN